MEALREKYHELDRDALGELQSIVGDIDLGQIMRDRQTSQARLIDHFQQATNQRLLWDSLLNFFERNPSHSKSQKHSNRLKHIGLDDPCQGGGSNCKVE